MTAAEEEALAESGEDLLVEDLPEGLINELTCSPGHPAAKKACMDTGAGHTSINSPATSSDSALAQPSRSPMPLAAAAPASPSSGPMPTPAATVASPNAPALHAAAYASVVAGVNPAPALPASLFASPAPGGSPRNLRRARTTTATSMLLPLRRRVVVTLLLPEAVLGSHRTELLAGINAQLCGFMFDSSIIPPFEHTVGESLRVARRVYGRLLFSWPSQEDAAAFRKLFPLMLKISNSRPVMLKVYVDRFEAFTAAKAAGAPTLSIRKFPLEFDPEDIRASLLGTTDEDGAHWLADLTDFHRASDPYEDTFFTHLAGLPVATPDDPNFERIPSEIMLETNKPAMLLNFSSHVCSLCGNNHRASHHEAFAARRRGRLTNKNTISIAQLQQANVTTSPLVYPPPSPQPNCSPPTPALTPRCPSLPKSPPYPLPRCLPPCTAVWAHANPTFNLTLPTPLAPPIPLPAPGAPPHPASTPVTHLSPTVLPSPAPHVVGLLLTLPPSPHHPPLPALSNPYWQTSLPRRSALATNVPSSVPPTVGPPPTLMTPPYSHSPHASSASRSLCSTLDPPLPAPTHFNPSPHNTPPPSPSEDGPPPSHTLTPHPHPPPAPPPPRRPHFLTEPLALFPSNTPPTLGAFPPRVSPEDGPAAHPHAGTETLPSPPLSPLFLTAPSPASPTPRLLPSPPSLPIPLLSDPTAIVPSALSGPPDPQPHMVLPLSVLTLTSPSYPTPPTLPPPLIPAPLSTPSPPLLPPPPPNTNPIQSPLPPPPNPQPHWSPPTPALTPCCSSLPKSPPSPLPCCFPPPYGRPGPCQPHFQSDPTHSPRSYPSLSPRQVPPHTLPSPPSPTSPPQCFLLRPPMSWGSYSLSRPPHTTPPSLPSPTPIGKLPSQDAQPLPPTYPPLSPLQPHFLTEPLALFPSNTPPTLGAFPPRVSPEDGPAAHPHAGTETLPSPSLSPLFLTAPSPASPTPRLLPFPPSLPIPLLSDPIATVPSALTGPPDPQRNLLGTHAAPTAFRNDPGLLYIGLDDWVEYWTCALCDFTCGAALNSAMEHIQSNLHATRVKASAHRPAAKDDFGPWRALTLLQQKAMVTAFLRGRP
ncbi:unnamed protein product [Closterium sp. NIES-64]|nr:unnamed protein product [Closterium sp. NIES-64]